MKEDQKNIVLDLSFNFSLNIIRFTELLESQKKFALARQLFRSGTSIGANIREAQSAESRYDFIHKIKIAAKEAEETEYWLQLCEKSSGYPDPANLSDQIVSLKRITGKIISTARKGA